MYVGQVTPFFNPKRAKVKTYDKFDMNCQNMASVEQETA